MRQTIDHNRIKLLSYLLYHSRIK